jgi:hypothetical protein
VCPKLKPKKIERLASPLLEPIWWLVTIKGPATEQEAKIEATLTNNNKFLIFFMIVFFRLIILLIQ